MKLLFDENLPSTLARRLAQLYPGCAGVADVNLMQRPDERIRAYAKEHGFIVVTKDVHFYRACVAAGHPPKVIWVALGNCHVRELTEAFTAAFERIKLFAEDDQTFLVLR